MTRGTIPKGAAPSPGERTPKARADAQAAIARPTPYISPEQWERIAEQEAILEAEQKAKRDGTAQAVGKADVKTWEPVEGVDFIRRIEPKKTAADLVGLDYLRGVVNDERADPALRQSAAHKLASIERYAEAKPDFNQVHRWPRTEIQAEIARIKALLAPAIAQDDAGISGT